MLRRVSVLHHAGGYFHSDPTNAVTRLRSSLTGIIPADLKVKILSWFDDVLIHPSTAEGLPESVRSFLDVCVWHNLKLHPANCKLFAMETRWCAGMLSVSSLRYDPRRLDGLLSMGPQTTGSNLKQFVCALLLVKQGIPNFRALFAPLQEFMDLVYDNVGKRSKRAVLRVLLADLKLDNTEKKAFETCMNAL